jgi:hypothetical protein
VSQLKELRKSILLGIYISLMMIFILPVWLTHSFVTINGPFDFYLSEIYFDLANANSPANEYYQRIPIEFAGSFQLAVMYIKAGFNSNTLFDKILFSLWISAFLLLARSITLSLNPKADYRPFLFFSIVFCAPLINGDWNFLGSVIFFLLGMKILTGINTYKHPAPVFLLLFLTNFFLLWCSFFWFIMFSALQIIIILLNPSLLVRKKFLWAATAPLPAILFPSLFFNITGLNFEFANISDQLQKLLNMELLKTFPETVWWITFPLSALFGILWVYSLLNTFIFLKPNLNHRFWHRVSMGFSIISLVIFLILHNKFDSDFNDTFVFLAIIFLLFSLSCLRIKKIYMILAGLFCLLVTIEHLRMQYLAWDQLSLKAGEYESFEMKFDTSKNLKLDVFNESKNESNLPYLISRNNKNLFIHDTFRNETEFSAHFLKRKQLPDTSNLVLRNIRDGIFPETITCFKENNTCIYSK